MRVALVQRILAPYRVETFRRLAARPGVDLTVFHGKGIPGGQWHSMENPEELQTHQLRTLSKNISFSDREYYMAFHPGLLPSLQRGRFDVVLSEGATNILDNLPLALWCRVRGVPLVVWDSGLHGSRPMSTARRLGEPIHRRILRGAAACVGYGNVSLEYFASLGISPERRFLARNTLDMTALRKDVESWAHRIGDLEAIRSELGMGARRIILHVGSLYRNKALDPLLEAFARLERDGEPVGLVIVGDGPDRARLERLSASIGCVAVRFLGKRTIDVAAYAMISEIAVIPTRATIAVNVMLGYGLPVVVAGDRGPEQEIIDPGVNGCLVKPGNNEDTERILRAWLAGEMTFAPAEEIRRRAYESLDLERMVDGLESALVFATRLRKGGRLAFRASGPKPRNSMD